MRDGLVSRCNGPVVGRQPECPFKVAGTGGVGQQVDVMDTGLVDENCILNKTGSMGMLVRIAKVAVSGG